MADGAAPAATDALAWVFAAGVEVAVSSAIDWATSAPLTFADDSAAAVAWDATFPCAPTMVANTTVS